MEISREEVQHIAELSRLALSEEEVERYRKDLSAVLSYMDTLKRADTASVGPAEHAMPVPQLLRSDTAVPSFSREEILKNAPNAEEGFFSVPKVIES